MATYTCENCVFGLKMPSEGMYLCMTSFKCGLCSFVRDLDFNCMYFVDKSGFPQVKLAQQVYNDFLKVSTVNGFAFTSYALDEIFKEVGDYSYEKNR